MFEIIRVACYYVCNKSLRSIIKILYLYYVCMCLTLNSCCYAALYRVVTTHICRTSDYTVRSENLCALMKGFGSDVREP
jgi:hypothetical protein